MLPKTVYSKVIQGLRHIKKQWDDDRLEDPKRVPYEVDNQLRSMIERCMQEGKMQRSTVAIQDTIDYLLEKKELMKSPYGGIMFPLPTDAEPLPSKEEFIKQTKQIMDQNRI